MVFSVESFVNICNDLLKEYCQKTDKAFIARVALSEQVNQNNSIGYDKDDFPKNPHEYYVL
jgi:hypothetical protein